MFNREEYIMNNLEYKYNYLIDKGFNVLAIFLQGSQNYELDVYDDDYKSDIDAKAIVIPSLEDIVLNKQPISTTIVLENNEHIEVKDIRVMKEMFIKQNISYIELLYTNYYMYQFVYEDLVDRLRDMRDDISTINKNQFLRCIKGMSMEKYKALEHPYPTIKDKIDKYGYDPKQLHHILRLNGFATRYLLKDVPLKDCYISECKEQLIKIKKGYYDLETARKMADMYDWKTKTLCDANIFSPDEVNQEAINKLNKWVADVITYSLKRELREENKI